MADHAMYGIPPTEDYNKRDEGTMERLLMRRSRNENGKNITGHN